MTPMGHIGGSLITAHLVENYVFRSNVTLKTLILAISLGLLPDVDSLPALMVGCWKPTQGLLAHHRYPTHTLLFYLVMTFGVRQVFPQRISYLFLALTVVHLLLDTWGNDDGIMWLWPLSNRQFSLFPADLHAGDTFGLQFYRRYFRSPRVIVPEILLLAIGLSLTLYTLKLSSDTRLFKI
jgi:membrane-bound metal-dependent hydrolase YbcI (DUF457 family)